MQPKPIDNESLKQFLEDMSIPEPNSGCWLWLGAIAGQYGVFKRRAIFSGNIEAHRASYVLHNGQIKEGLFVLHKCDNKLCINPNHLTVGTNKENIDQAVERTKMNMGRKNGSNI